ncbi:MAG: hypothetical protein ACPGGA_04140 [Balneolaceae bacterium]
MEKYIMSTAFDEVMKELKQMRKEYRAEQKELRKEAKKFKKDKSKLTKHVRKAGQHAPSNLDAFSEKNMYYSDSETQRYLSGTDYADTYNSTYRDWD